MEKLLFSASSACPVAPEDGTGVPQAKRAVNAQKSHTCIAKLGPSA